MALADLTFKIYDDSNLTSELGSTIQLTHYTDLSDGAQDFGPYYLGSTESSRTLKATSNPGVDNITLTPTYVLADWTLSTSYSLNDKVVPTTPNGYVYIVVTAGTSDSSEPTWPTGAIGDQVTDGGVVWELYAADRPITEIKLATSSGGLDGASGGAALTVGTSVSSGVANAFTFYIRVTNTITTVGTNYGTPELALNINSVVEESSV